MTWEVQSQRVRQTQSRLDAKLTAYSQYVSDLARKNAAPSDAVSVDMSGSTPSVPVSYTHLTLPTNREV